MDMFAAFLVRLLVDLGIEVAGGLNIAVVAMRTGQEVYFK
jgi:hypothetical protein